MSDERGNDERSEARFVALLGRWSEAGADERPGIEAELFERYQEPLAVLVLDMSGFSTSVIRHGIVHFLAKIQRMRSLLVPRVHDFGGEVVKYIGDDILAVFPEPRAAYDCARAMMETIDGANRQAQPDMSMEVAIGIGFGPCLYVPGVDVWGDQANRAFKLGEDTAAPGEILLTNDAATELGDLDLVPIEVSISGVTLNAFRG